ncbi:Bug family tripartite tricarboxylate transporter substrate binding protein [Falsiroseomonas tokyonensis]|uniref:Bug family tripartite tricarboxylate transporter substrate binding protein n=1 Tax=Falsiroseomonas tokyonensis TaxID=430521 RepID=A0ABV7C0C5_9PROT|nr:tripartite tricarboxylate transporter substrate binding protein [Falsiroseomonas tokyonensis]MBU8540363.1 tripartite tricarboxylate transporter substrate binding protein [Falsiroseomonas tokyonensis]
MKRRHLLAATAATLASPALAQGAWPSRPIRLVVPFPPGAANDTLGRAMADQLSPRLGQAVVVENRGGAGGTIGSEAVARSAPDGYTLLLGHIGTLAVNVAMYPNLTYSPVRDFAPVAMIATTPNVLVVNPQRPYQDLPSLVAFAKANPGRLRYCTAGNGSAGHTVMLAFLHATKLDMEHVPYRGLGPALNDLVAGHVDLTWGGAPTVMPLARQGLLRALGVSSAQRVPSLPELPTAAETVAPGFDAVPWYGIAAPTGTPPAVIARLNTEINASLNTADVSARLRQDGAEPLPMTPEAFGQLIRSEVSRWSELIRAAGVTAN